MKIIGRYGGDAVLLLPAAVFAVAPLLNTVWGEDDMLVSYLYGIVTLPVAAYGALRRHRALRITLADILFGVWLLYAVLLTDAESLPVNVIVYCFAAWLWGRQLNAPCICRILVFAGIIQVLLLLLQWGDVLPSHHAYFPVTGSFRNPGPLGGFLSVCLMAAIALYRQGSGKLRILYIVLLSAGLILSDSRAAWIGALAGITYYVMLRLGIRPLLRVVCVIAVGVMFSLLAAVCYKSASARGRVAIWKVCIEMMKEYPVFGQGVDTFSANYMPQQARYIQEKATDAERHLMDNNRYAFNEFLCVTCEQGLTGLLLVMGILIVLWRASCDCVSLRICLLVYVVFSCFSYPLHVFFLQVCLFMVCGNLSARSAVVWSCPSVKPRILFVVPVIVLFGSSVLRGWHVMRARQAVYDFLNNDDMRALDYLETHLCTFIHDRALLDSYALALCLKEEHERSIPVLRQSIARFPATDKYIRLGNSFRSLALYSQAEKAYMQAAFMLPDRIYPRYCLFMLYRDMRQEEKAYRQALQIQRMFPKIESDYARELKCFVNEYLQSVKPVASNGK